MTPFQNEILAALREETAKPLSQADTTAIYHAVSRAAMNRARDAWTEVPGKKRACYLSAEFLIGRMVNSNLLNLGLLEEARALLKENGRSPELFDEVDDPALGNGGLGRLAACFLDSAATQDIPLDGFGIRYKYGLFRQTIEGGFQREYPDDWQQFGDPWSLRRGDERVKVHFAGQDVWAVPYDMPVIGYGGKTVNTLRLWQAEAVDGFDFALFNQQKYSEAVKNREEAEAISTCLYPNDDTDEGRKLRLKQEYFFSSASLQCIVRRYREQHGADFSHFPESYVVQLNDTHPTVAIPELLRILLEEELMDFDEALEMVKKVFAYTNHTIMPEALEKWSVDLFCAVLPHVYPYVVMLNHALKRELLGRGIAREQLSQYAILDGNMVHMARMAIYASHSTNGVAEIHTRILKESALKEWYALYPERFNNKTNGITQRRWLALCNPELSRFITDRIGSGWVTDLDQLKKLEPYAGDANSLRQFADIKKRKKEELARYVWEHDHFGLHTDFVFDVQIKRLHEYKRQLLNAFSIMDIYFALKDGALRDFHPTVFLFGAKAAPGYWRAKGIIKYINEVAHLVNTDPEVNQKMQVLFVSNYNVSYAEKLIPAADISQQISTAGTEASGTSNMKFMLNGAVTLGTYDGANIEIAQQAGEENNYIFGAKVEDIAQIAETYDPEKILAENPRIRRVVETLIDGTFSDGGNGMFRELYTALTKGASWHKPDHYYLLLDFIPYCEARLRANRDWGNQEAFAKKCLLNVANAGKFSSDRTIRQYAEEIWGL